jgi:cytochrome c oxidase subunit 2
MFKETNYIELVDHAFLFIVVISALLLVLITVLMIYFVVKYNRNKGAKGENIHGNVSLEVAWTVIPILLVMGMFYYGWVGYEQLSSPPDDAFVIKSTGKMWKWTFEYPDGITTDTLYVPRGKAIRINLNSLDVNHSFFIPAFRVKRDAMPNRDNFLWFNAEKTGRYDIACAEYCGLQHSYMYTKLVVMNPVDFEKQMAAEWKKIEKNSALPDPVK